ncbi:MAG: PaaI family thioesterase [Thermomicrobiales bacterium]|nr:PaaI family thioesterase [Thermomicrobiales bacterium]
MTESLSGTPLAVRDDHNCFGCGADNPWGLHLTFMAEPDGAVNSHWTPQVNHQGYDGMVHGGIISTVFDEVMAWAVTNAGIWAVTGRLSTTYRKPVEIGVPAIARAEIAKVTSRTAEVTATIRRASDGLLLAEATSLFVRVSPEQSAAWQEKYARAEASTDE